MYKKIFNILRNIKINIFDAIIIESIGFVLEKLLYVIVFGTDHINSLFYYLLYKVQWRRIKPPVYMDHNIDLNYLWKKRGNMNG